MVQTVQVELRHRARIDDFTYWSEPPGNRYTYIPTTIYASFSSLYLWSVHVNIRVTYLSPKGKMPWVKLLGGSLGVPLPAGLGGCLACGEGGVLEGAGVSSPTDVPPSTAEGSGDLPSAPARSGDSPRLSAGLREPSRGGRSSSGASGEELLVAASSACKQRYW